MIEERVRLFVAERFHWDSARGELRSDFPLIESNLVDSLGIFHLVTFLEQEYGVQIDDEELVPEHFATIADIARLVESKRASV